MPASGACVKHTASCVDIPPPNGEGIRVEAQQNLSHTRAPEGLSGETPLVGVADVLQAQVVRKAVGFQMRET